MTRFPLVAAIAALCFALILAALPADAAEPVSFAALAQRTVPNVAAAAPVPAVSFAALEHRQPAPVAALAPAAKPAAPPVLPVAVPATTAVGWHWEQRCTGNGCRMVKVRDR